MREWQRESIRNALRATRSALTGVNKALWSRDQLTQQELKKLEAQKKRLLVTAAQLRELRDAKPDETKAEAPADAAELEADHHYEGAVQ